jgi:hypothetical protein
LGKENWQKFTMTAADCLLVISFMTALNVGPWHGLINYTDTKAFVGFT